MNKNQIQVAQERAKAGDIAAYKTLIDNYNFPLNSIRKDIIFDYRILGKQDNDLFEECIDALIKGLADSDRMISWTAGTSLESLREYWREISESKVNIILDYMEKALHHEHPHSVTTALKSFFDCEYIRYSDEKDYKTLKKIAEKCILPNFLSILEITNKYLHTTSPSVQEFGDVDGGIDLNRPFHTGYADLSNANSLFLSALLQPYIKFEDKVIDEKIIPKVVPLLEKICLNVPIVYTLNVLALYLLIDPTYYAGANNFFKKIAEGLESKEFSPLIDINTVFETYKHPSKLAGYLSSKIEKLKA